jgi:hypothetical protein
MVLTDVSTKPVSPFNELCNFFQSFNVLEQKVFLPILQCNFFFIYNIPQLAVNF